jgi:hypothetical protein
MKHLVILLLLAIAFHSCGFLYDRYARYPLTISQESFKGNQLRIEGMYLNKDNTGTDMFFLYSNGILRRGFELEIDSKTPQQIEEYLRQIKGTNCCNNYPPSWGLFKIDGNLINVEMWRSGDTFEKYPTQKSYGEILNDTTIILHGFHGTSNTSTFHFVPLSIKPDSTNRFIN